MNPPGQAILSVDVEDYFHVEAFSGVINRADWDRFPRRVEANTCRMLDLLDEAGVKATFFILGWVAERHGSLVREIARRGHELACHSYWHRPIYSLTRQEFQEDTALAKQIIEQAAGLAVFGYRAPSFSVTLRSLWALETLAELGFRYDSSVFPIRHDLYGIPGAPRVPFRAGGLVEFPMTTFHWLGGLNFPVGGGGYLRMLPFWYTRAGVRRAWGEGLPLVTYVHPWELDPDQPRVPAPLKSRLRHYSNLGGAADRLRKLLRLAHFVPFRDCGLLEAAPASEFLTGKLTA